MRYRLIASYQGSPYEAGIGPAGAEVVLFAACPPPEELGFEPAPGHWRKPVRRTDVEALWESRPVGQFGGDPCIVLDDLGDRLHIGYLGHDAYRARQLGYWEVDRGVFELITPRQEVAEVVEERRPLAGRLGQLPPGDAPLPLEAQAWLAASAARRGLVPVPRGWDSELPGGAGFAPAQGRAGTWPSAAENAGQFAGGLYAAPVTAPGLVPPGSYAAPEGPGRPVPAEPETAQLTAITGADHNLAMPYATAAGAAADQSLPGDRYAPRADDPYPARSDPYAARAARPGAGAARPELLGLPVHAPAHAAGAIGAADGLWAEAATHAVPRVRAQAGQHSAEAGQHWADYRYPDSFPGARRAGGREPAAERAVAATTPAQPAAGGTASGPALPPGASTFPPGGPGQDRPELNGSRDTVRLAAAAGRQEQPRRRRSRPHPPTQRIFADLATLAAIPAGAYAIGEEVDGALCLVPSAAGFEVYHCAGGARLEARVFGDEESAYFYLFGVLAADAVRTGALAPRD